jgi:hypothetical protein
MIEDAVHSHAPDVERTAGAVMRDTASSYHLRLGALTPIVYLTVKDSGVLFTARFLVEARTQRGIDERIWTAILDSIDEVSDVELAYPTIRTYLHGPIGVARVTDDEMPPSDAN